MLVIVLVMGTSLQTKGRVVFNFHDKLRNATRSTTTSDGITLNGQVIRVPELICPLGQRPDKLGTCRQRF